jgi:hypothetical protein
MFQPRGERSQREEVYAAMRDMPSDVVIPYAALPLPLGKIRGLREAVARTFERDQQRTVVCVRGEGWMIVRGVRQVDVVVRKRRQATRRLGRALQVAETVDRREMSAEDRVRADRELVATSTGYGVLRGLALKRLTIQDLQEWRRDHGL